MKFKKNQYSPIFFAVPFLLLIFLCSFGNNGLVPEQWKAAKEPDDSFLVKNTTISLEDAIFRGTTPEETITEYLKTYDFWVARPQATEEGNIIKTHSLILKNTLHLKRSVRLNISVIIKSKSIIVYSFAGVKAHNPLNWKKLDKESKAHLDVYLTHFTKDLIRCVNRDKAKLSSILVMPDTTANAALEQIGISIFPNKKP